MIWSLGYWAVCPAILLNYADYVAIFTQCQSHTRGAWRGFGIGRKLAVWSKVIGMPVDPFKLDKDKAGNSELTSTEFGFGAGHYPNPAIDYSDGGSKSRFPIADPDRDAQELELAMIKRTDLSDPAAQLNPFELGNTDRYGAQPPLVRERKRPKTPRRKPVPRAKMEREF